MALSPSINDREFAKFTETGDGTSVRVTLSGGLAPEKYDRVDITYPTSTTEVYDFKLSGDTVAVITLTYASSAKSELVSAVRS